MKPPGPGTLSLYFATSDGADAHKQLASKGVKVNDVKGDLFGPGCGVKWFNLEYPDGNLVHLAQAQSMSPLLQPIERPKSLFMKMGYDFIARQSGKPSTPRTVFPARMSTAFTMLAASGGTRKQIRIAYHDKEDNESQS
jgi:hypothetical protein